MALWNLLDSLFVTFENGQKFSSVESSQHHQNGENFPLRVFKILEYFQIEMIYNL